MAKKKTTKKTKVKQKTSVSQQVNVYVTKRGGGGTRRPPQPSQAQQLLQTITPLLSGIKPMIQVAQPFQQSPQQLDQLINILRQRQEPPQIVINAPRGEQGSAGPAGEQGPAGRQGARGFPGRNYEPSEPSEPSESEVSLEDVRRVARGIAPPSERSGVSSWATPSIESGSRSPLSLRSFAFDFENASVKSGQSYVLDLPDAPLVRASQPAISNAPIRLDNPHEDVPLDEIEGKQEAKRKRPIVKELPQREEEEEREVLTPYQIPSIDNITEEYIRSLPVISKATTTKVTLRQLANNYGITLTRDKKNKEQIINTIWTEIQRRKANPNLSSSAPR